MTRHHAIVINAPARARLGALVPGEHVHLDELLGDLGPPGSSQWLPIVRKIADELGATGQRWLVSLPVGFIQSAPTGELSVEDAFAMAQRDELVEPPAVHLLPPADTPNTWKGEYRAWERRHGDRVETVSVSRSVLEESAGEPWTVQLSFTIRESVSGPT